MHQKRVRGGLVHLPDDGHDAMLEEENGVIARGAGEAGAVQGVAVAVTTPGVFC